MFKFQIGTIERRYRVFRTTAPKAYDGFGTITIFFDKTDRYVIIDERHQEWQTQRYGSGNHAAVEQPNLEHSAQAELMKRLVGPGANPDS